jgi:hypothetical protein
MNTTIQEISKELNIPFQELINRGLIAYLEYQIRLAEEDIADIREKYLVTNKSELEKKIKNKKIYSHPAWEDLISWENTENYIRKLKATLKRFQ